MNVEQIRPLRQPVEIESVQVINAPIEDLWSLVSDFSNVSQWHPDVVDSRIESGSAQQPGVVRSLKLRNGMQLKEKLVAISAPEWFYTYSVIDSPLPIRDHESTVRFKSLANSKTEIRWTARFVAIGADSSALADGIKKGVLDLGIEGLRQAVARKQRGQRVIAKSMPYQKHYAKVFDRSMAYVETGRGDPVVFLHGNPTSSYLWRNILPYLEDKARCIAPDLIGMGDSEKLPNSGPGSYTFVEHRRYLDALLTSLRIERNVTFVGHDWGSVLAFDWARRHPHAVRGIAHMEGIVRPIGWERWSPQTRSFFQQLRSPAGERTILEENQFVEWLLPKRIMRKLTDKEMETYRRPFREAGEARRPTLTWPRQLPIEGEPPDVVEIVRLNGTWLRSSPVPKLFVNADPGTISTDEREFCRSWPNTTEVTVKGLHFIQEDSPDEIGEALASWHTSHLAAADEYVAD